MGTNIWPEALENRAAELARADINDNNCWLRAYKNTLVIANSTVLADLVAAEANFSGYAAVALTATNPSVTVPGTRAYFDCNQVTFTPNGSGGGQLIGGYFATNNTNTELVDVYPLSAAYNTVASTNFAVTVRRGSRGQKRCV